MKVRSYRQVTMAGGVAIAALALMLSGCTTGSVTPGATGGDGGGDAQGAYDPLNEELSAWCGDADVKVAAITGQNNAWRKTALYIQQLEAAKCSSVTEFVSANANGDLQQANSDFNNFLAQGFNAITVVPDWADAQLPAFRTGLRNGAAVVPWNQTPGGTAGSDYTATYTLDATGSMADLASWAQENTADGESKNFIYVGGFAGSSQTEAEWEAIKEVASSSDKLTPLLDTYVVGEYAADVAQKNVSALLAQYGTDIDVVFTNYGVPAEAVIRAFDLAGLQIPDIYLLASTNGLGCTYQDLKEQGKSFNLFTGDGSLMQASAALRLAVAAANGKEVMTNEQQIVPRYADTSAGKELPCDPSVPADADMTSGLTIEQLKEALN